MFQSHADVDHQHEVALDAAFSSEDRVFAGTDRDITIAEALGH